MNNLIPSSAGSTRLRSATVLRVHEEFCEIVSGNQFTRARYATHFPAPRVKRVSPGHLVATGEAPDGAQVVLWRWYDAVVLDEVDGLVRMWEPAHGEVSARRRHEHWHPQPGSRAYLSAGLPGADWWVAGPIKPAGEGAVVELGEVEQLYTDNDLWDTLV